MKKLFTIVAFVIFLNSSFSQNVDSFIIKNLDSRIELLDNQLKEVRRDEINYKIEKDLLKETYSNNYERISLVITIVLGIIGLFGYLGLKDINSIKKEYSSELSKLRAIKSELELKIKNFNDVQIKYDKEISDIIKQNEEQNKKIKILELKEQISNLMEEKKYAAGLECCLKALELSPNDISILIEKARIYSLTGSYPESIQTSLKIIELDPKQEVAIQNLAESYILNNQNEESDAHIEKNKQFFKDESALQAIKLFAVLKLFNQGKIKELIQEVKKQIDQSDLNIKKIRIEDWDLQDAITYITSSKESNQKTIIQDYCDYIQGKTNGKEFLEKLGKIKI